MNMKVVTLWSHHTIRWPIRSGSFIGKFAATSVQESQKSRDWDDREPGDPTADANPPGDSNICDFGNLSVIL